MSLEGEICGKCDKGKLHQIKHKVDEGLYVDGFKCKKCGEIWYSEQVMSKLEDLKRVKSIERHLVKVGNSLAAIIPVSIARKLNLKEKEKILVQEENGEIIIKPSIVSG